jgi:hypothetical protein
MQSHDQTPEERQRRATILRQLGHITYGQYWQTPMAQTLDINPRTLRRWLSLEWEIPQERLNMLRDLAHRLRTEVTGITNTLDHIAAEGNGSDDR